MEQKGKFIKAVTYKISQFNFMAKIKQVKAREILNSKGVPTVETSVILSDGSVGTSSYPIGTSVGSYEAWQLKDSEQKRYQGQGVQKAIQNIESQIAPNIVGLEADRQQEIDKIMIDLDGTQNKGRFGVNAILSVSMSVAKAASTSSVLPLFLYLREFIKKENLLLKIPTPAFNLLNGGKHARGTLNFQEFLVIPASSKTYSESLEIGVSIYRALGKTLEFKSLSTLTGDEGGYSPSVANNIDAFSLLRESIERTSIQLEFDVFFGLDSSASNFFSDKKYYIKDKPAGLSSNELMSYYEELNRNHHLLYIEDPLAEDDWGAWSDLCSRMSQTTIIAGGDLVATNPYRLQIALNKKAITAIVIKPSQIGTVIEALAVVEIARQSGLKIIVSNRGGETNDNFIADFAVAVSADYVKFGAPARGERVEKYNRLLQIEDEINAL